MEKVVYLLGAGFSAPLGLPVMSTFLIKSKDAFAQDPEKYAHFSKVFETIKDMNACKSYFEADLFNIEEILSILEMQEGVEASSVTRSFTQYIKDVVQHYTPRPRPPTVPPNDNTKGISWHNEIFGTDTWSTYGAFVANLFGVQANITWQNPNDSGYIRFMRAQKQVADYSVITLNYDSVLEDVCSFVNQHHGAGNHIHFQRDREWSGDKTLGL